MTVMGGNGESRRGLLVKSIEQRRHQVHIERALRASALVGKLSACPETTQRLLDAHRARHLTPEHDG